MGERWDCAHRRPAWRWLPIDRLEAAGLVLEQVAAGGPEVLGGFNRRSLAYRLVARRAGGCGDRGMGGRPEGVQGQLSFGK